MIKIPKDVHKALAVLFKYKVNQSNRIVSNLWKNV